MTDAKIIIIHHTVWIGQTENEIVKKLTRKCKNFCSLHTFYKISCRSVHVLKNRNYNQKI